MPLNEQKLDIFLFIFIYIILIKLFKYMQVYSAEKYLMPKIQQNLIFLH